MTELVVFVASPSDVQSERDLLQGIIDKVNELAPTTGQILRLMQWEKDVRPGIGDDPQDVVNRQVRAADITIVVFWKRLGTPTRRAESGTVEEFDRAVEEALEEPRREVLTYFKTALIDLHNDDLGQAEKVKAFRHRIASTTLDCEFRTGAEFESKVSRHLIDAVLSRARHVAEQAAAGGQDRVADFVRGLLARRYDEPADAIRWFRLAAEQGHGGAIAELALMLREQHEFDEADNWFRAAAAEGNPMAAYNVGLRLKERGERWPARDWLRRGAEGGEVAAMYNLGLLLKEDGDRQEAELWLRRGAEGGDVAAMYTLGLLAKEGEDRAEAELWLRRGAEGGDVAAMYDLGLLLKEGYGDDEAKMWLECARKRGHPGPFE